MANLNRLSLATLLFGIAFFGASFTYFDRPIAYYFHSTVIPVTSMHFFQLITLLGDPRFSLAFVLLSFLIAISMLFRQPQNRLANNLLFMGLAMTAAIFVESSLKYLLGRCRPELLFQQGLYGFHFLTHQFLMNSAPSGHTTRFFVLVTAITLIWRKGFPIMLLMGLLVALSRLVLEFHYLSDVMFGALLGMLITLWVAKIYYSLTISSHSLGFLRQIRG